MQFIRTMRAGVCRGPTAAVVLCAWAAVAQGTPAALTIALQPSAIALPILVAQAQGFFAAEGVTVRSFDCDGGAVCMRSLLDGKAELTVTSELPVVFASFLDSPVSIVSTIATSTRNLRLIGRRSAGIGDAASLKDKRIGVTFGVSSHYYLDVYLLFHGLDPKKTQIVDIEPSGLVGALQRREIDAMAGFGRQTWPALKELGADGITLDNPRVYTETYHLVATRRALAERLGDIVRVLRAVRRAEEFIRTQPLAASLLLQARLKVDPAYADSIASTIDFRLGLDQSLVSTMEGEARWALREGHVDAGRKIPNFLQFIDPRPLRELSPPSATIR